MMARSILITGATGKIGQVLVRHFLLCGDIVIANGKSSEKLKIMQDKYSTLPGKLEVCCFDLMHEYSSQKIVDDLIDKKIT